MNAFSALENSLKQLAAELDRVWQRLDLAGREQHLQKCQEIMADPTLWQADASKAQATSREMARLEKLTAPWFKLRSDLNSLRALLADCQAQGDASSEELQPLIRSWSEEFETLKKELHFSGPHDGHEVIMSIFAGAGGTDAQDWVQMLLRMYSRWAEHSKVKTELISQSKGEEAGLKSVSLYLKGRSFLYGRLKGEHGVHRLVRLSPFNAQNLRQTSFAKVEVVPAVDEPEEIELDDSELRFDFFRSGGHGGQSVNTTDSAVRVTHLPTKLTVVIQNERSQIQNKQLALTVLRSRLARLKAEQHAQTLSELKGEQLANEWGSQIRNYVLHPYKQVKDLRSKYVTTEAQKILDGYLDDLLKAQLSFSAGDA